MCCLTPYARPLCIMDQLVEDIMYQLVKDMMAQQVEEMMDRLVEAMMDQLVEVMMDQLVEDMINQLVEIMIQSDSSHSHGNGNESKPLTENICNELNLALNIIWLLGFIWYREYLSSHIIKVYIKDATI